ncbi:hypothetical protein BT96DRAFT_1006980 [Gymnopus androsaceus JB14]|uniref:Uncharacterized protein n=1 Tax=Gymnopus androsaceus JB14 TaxID=1447944 RepID=A0A6A4GJD8_9AGAR|nr:hypothetical protein BT96DRAFT_1006980 [Gymnopus androsaceus JB14]
MRRRSHGYGAARNFESFDPQTWRDSDIKPQSNLPAQFERHLKRNRDPERTYSFDGLENDTPRHPSLFKEENSAISTLTTTPSSITVPNANVSDPRFPLSNVRLHLLLRRLPFHQNPAKKALFLEL